VLPPFAWWEIDREGKITRQAEVPARVLASWLTDGSPGSSYLVGMHLHQLDHAYLLGIADTRSDIRRFVLFDSTGHIMRASRVDASIGFLHALPEKHLLLALRRTDRLELVVYVWHWDAPSEENKP
jgi:hypothetical protein